MGREASHTPNLIEMQNGLMGQDYGLYRNQTQAGATLNSELLLFKVWKLRPPGGFVYNRQSRLTRDRCLIKGDVTFKFI